MKPAERQQWADWFAERQGAPQAEKPPPKYHKRTPAQLEHEIQKTFIDWCALASAQRPELALIYAIPNGGHRHPAVGAKMKAEGVKAGMPDLHLPVPRGAHGSLYIEVKAPGEKPTKHQLDRHAELRSAGNVVVVCDGVQQLIDITLAYLEGRVQDDQGRLSPDR